MMNAYLTSNANKILKSDWFLQSIVSSSCVWPFVDLRHNNGYALPCTETSNDQ